MAWHQDRGLFLLECLFHNVVAMRKREMQQHLQRCPHSHQSIMTKEMAPTHLSMRSLLGSTNDEILEVAEEVYHGQYGVVPSILPHQHQDHFMAELHEELGQCLIKAWPLWHYKSSQVPIQGQKMLSCPLLIPGSVALPKHLWVCRQLSLLVVWM